MVKQKIIFLVVLMSFVFVSMSEAGEFSSSGAGKQSAGRILTNFFYEKRPDPIDDLRKLEKLFYKFRGELYSSGDRIVRWKDTKMFRLFEFKDHSIVIYPYNWTETRFELILFRGHVKRYDNLFDSILLKYKPNNEDRTFYLNDTILMNKNENNKVVGFDNFYFGERKEDVTEKVMPIINKMWVDKKQRKIRIDLLTFAKNDISGSTMNFRFFFYFENNSLDYLNFWTENITKIGSYRIGNPILTVLNEGEIELHSTGTGSRNGVTH